MIPQNDFLSKPYDDEKMKYDLSLRRYVLMLDKAEWDSGVDLVDTMGSVEDAEFALELVSKVCYSYIQKFKDSKWQEYLLYYLSHSKKFRQFLYEFMVDTLLYNSKDGGFMVTYSHGINMKEMTRMAMESDDTVSVVGSQMVENAKLKEKAFRYSFDVIEDGDW